LIAGLPGPLTTRTSDTAGVITLGAHPFLDNDVLSVCWAGGSRIKATVTAHDATTITIGSGTGDNLPVATTPVVVAKVLNIDSDFAGDKIEMIAAVCGNDAAVGFYSSADALLLQLKLSGGDPQGEPWWWVKGAGVANPLAGVTVGYILVGNGEAVPATFNLAALYDSV
jgi:hypothetical protein